MYINKLTQHEEINREIKLASEGKFWHWKRTFVLKVDHEICTVALNIFERIKMALVEFCGANYFSRVFENKTVHVLYRMPIELETPILEVIQATPKFANYGFESDPNVHLTDLSLRPSNFFYAALLGENKTTMPGSNELFSFIDGNRQVRQAILDLEDDEVIEFNADRQGELYKRRALVGECDLKTYFGNGTFRISGKELKAQIQSQTVHLSPLLTQKFYLGLKEALASDQTVVLPGSERDMYTMERLSKCKELPHVKEFIQKAIEHPAEYDLDSGSLKNLMELTLYQMGSMVVKTEDYYSFVGNGLKLRERQPGAQDSIMLISACGIRGFHTNENAAVNGNKNHARDREIMKHTFKCALDSAKTGYAVFPAVGMGVWAGDPDVYWRAFFDAVIESNNEIKYIFVNPGHKPTYQGPYKGSTGNEFDKILAEYGQNPKLAKLVNLFSSSTDLLLLAQNLKNQFPDVNVALFNASDPDVTLGNHVGEYVNNLCHANTTEENYAAAGSSCLGFEEITGVLLDEKRIVQHR